jgi:hypothetical protein
MMGCFTVMAAQAAIHVFLERHVVALKSWMAAFAHYCPGFLGRLKNTADTALEIGQNLVAKQRF